MKLSGTNKQNFIYTMRFHACILDIKTLRKISMNVPSHDNQAKTVFRKAELKYSIMPDT